MMNKPCFETLAARQRGFTLVELMIALAVGLIVLAAIAALTVATVSANKSVLKSTRLDQELRAVMQVLTRDLRRVGYDGNLNDGNAVPITITPETYAGNANACVLYAYDRNDDGALTTSSPDERFGFRFDPTLKAVEARSSNAACDASTGWENITQEAAIEITSLQFVPNYRTVTIVINPVTGATRTAQVREIDIVLQGRLKDDPSVVRQIQETIRVRNDELT
jgi:prepilin peptidase dependent protein B